MNYKRKVLIGCVHLLALPGSPGYDDLEKIYETAKYEATCLEKAGFDALIIENFRDRPFFPDEVPNITVASIAAVAREIKNICKIPIGIAVLRNDAQAAMAIATAVGADFIRVNVHVGAVLSSQGIIQGKSYKTLRLKKYLNSNVKIYSDVMVKHSKSLAYDDICQEVYDLEGLSDGIIVSGELTGKSTSTTDVLNVKNMSTQPVLIGSGITCDNLVDYFDLADGFIVGSILKKDGLCNNIIDYCRAQALVSEMQRLRKSKGID